MSNYFNENAILRIDLNDFEYSKRIVDKVLNSDNIYEEKLDAIIESKKKYLNEYSLFALIYSFCKLGPDNSYRTNVLMKPSKSLTENGFLNALKRRLYVN